MERRKFLIASGAVASTALAGCLGSTVGSGESSGSPRGRSITVRAVGETSGEPDLAILQLSVEARGDRALAVRSELATDADALVAALKDEGVPENNITTERFQIRERIDRRAADRDGVAFGGDIPDEYRYYEGTHAYRIELEDTDRVGTVIDAAVGAGADEIGRVTFTLSDEKRSTLREEALTKAVENARSEAETIAEGVGATVVEVTIVDASGGQITPIRREMLESDAAAGAPEEVQPPTQVEVGDVTVTVSIQVQYKIAG